MRIFPEKDKCNLCASGTFTHAVSSKLGVLNVYPCECIHVTTCSHITRVTRIAWTHIPLITPIENDSHEQET